MTIEGIVRAIMVFGLSRALNLYIVTEYPKSGGSWLSQMMSEYLNIPFPRNQIPRLRSNIMHGHYLYFPTMKNIIVVFRDGRDVMISFYFHSFFKNELFNHALVNQMRKKFSFNDYNDIENNLPQFIRYKFTKKWPPRFSWAEFVEDWINKNVTMIKYETLLQNPVKTFGRAIEEVAGEKVNLNLTAQIVEKYSFRNLTKRNPGFENRSSFLRKGVSGDWKNYFNKESCELFDYYAGDQLIKLGYEKDRSWV